MIFLIITFFLQFIIVERDPIYLNSFTMVSASSPSCPAWWCGPHLVRKRIPSWRWTVYPYFITPYHRSCPLNTRITSKAICTFSNSCALYSGRHCRVKSRRSGWNLCLWIPADTLHCLFGSTHNALYYTDKNLYRAASSSGNAALSCHVPIAGKAK